MNLKTYDDARVTMIRSTLNPGSVVQSAIRLTQTKHIELKKPVSAKLLKFVISADHMSVLEHVNMTFALEGVSRSFLAQITRHRMGSFTSASQHYADYRDMPMVVSAQYKEAFGAECCTAGDGSVVSEIENSLIGYTHLVDENGIPPEEARQILPNACVVNLIWTVNARALENFFTQRLCSRNVEEMVILAKKIWRVVHDYWPAFADVCGPYCLKNKGNCNQGQMSCKVPWKTVINDET